MIPRLKAEELVQKFYVEVIYGASLDYSELQLRVFKIKAITCALHAVDELIQEEESWISPTDEPYWTEVKKEIEKL